MNQIKCYRKLSPENTCGESSKEEIHNLKNSGVYNKLYNEKISNLKIYKDLLQREIQNTSEDFNILFVVLSNKERYSNEILVGNHVSLGILHLIVNDSVRTDRNSVDSVVTCSCVEIRKNCLNDLLRKYVSVDNKIIKVPNDWMDEQDNSNLLENTFRQRRKKKYRHKEKKEKKEKKIQENQDEKNIKSPMEDFRCFKLRNKIYVHPQNIQSLFEIFSTFSTDEEKDVFYRIIEFHIESKLRNESNSKEMSFYKNGSNDEMIHYRCIRIIIVNNIQDTISLGHHSLHYFFEFFLRMKESFDINQCLLRMKTESHSLIVQYLNYLVETETQRTSVEHVVSLGLDIKFLFATSRIKRLQTINQFVDSFLKQMNQVYYSMQKKTLEYSESEFFKLEERITMLRCLLQYYEGMSMENKSVLQKYLNIVKLVYCLELSVITKEQVPSLCSHENNIFRMIRYKEFEKVYRQIYIYKHNEEERCKKKGVNIKKNLMIEDVNKEIMENQGIRNYAFPKEEKDSVLKKKKNTLLRIKVHEKESFENINKITIFNNTLEEECIDTRIHCPQQNNKRFCQDVLVGSCMWSEKDDSKEDSSINGSNSESDMEARLLLKNMKKNQQFINKVNSIYDTNKKKNKKQKKKELDKKAKNLMKEVEGYLGVPSIPLKKKDTSQKKNTEEEEIDGSWSERLTSDYKDRKEESTKLKKSKKIEETTGNHLDNLEKKINTQITQLLKKKMECNPTMSKKRKEVHKVNVLNVVVDSSSSVGSSSCEISSSSSSGSLSSVDSSSSSIISQQTRKPNTKRNRIKCTQKNTFRPREKGTHSIKKHKEIKEIKKTKEDSNNENIQTTHGKPYGPWNIQNFQNWKDKNILKQMLCNSNDSVYSFSICGKRKRKKKKNDSKNKKKSSKDVSPILDEQEYIRNKENESIRNISKENSLYTQPQNIPYSCVHDPTDLLKYHKTIQEFLKNTQVHFLKEQYKEDSHELELLKRIQFAKKVLKEYSRLIKIHYNIRIDDSLLLKKALKNHSKSRSSKDVDGSLSECDSINEWTEPSMKEEGFNKSCFNMDRVETYSLCEKDRNVFSSYENDKEELKHLIRKLILELKNCVRVKRNKNEESVCFHDEPLKESFSNHRNSFYHRNKSWSNNETDINGKQCSNDRSQTCVDNNHTCVVDERKIYDPLFMCNECKNKKQEHSFFVGPLCNVCVKNIRNKVCDEHEMNNREEEGNTLRINDQTKDIESKHRTIKNSSSELITDKISKDQNRKIDFFDASNESANPKCTIIECNEGKEESRENKTKQNKTEQAHVPHFKLYLEFDGLDGNMSSNKITSLENTTNYEKKALQMKRSKEYKPKDNKNRKEQEDEPFRELFVKEKESIQQKKKYDSPKKTKEEPISSNEKHKVGKRKTRKTIHRMASIVSNELKKKELAEEKEKKLQLERKQLHLHNRKKNASFQCETAIHEENKRQKQNRNTEQIINTCYDSTPEIKSQFIDCLHDSSSNSSCEQQDMYNLEKNVSPDDELEYGLERQRKPCRKSNEIKIIQNQHDVRLRQIPPASNTNDFQELKMDFFFDDDRILFPSSLKETTFDKKGRKKFHELCKVDGKETIASSNFSFLNSPEGFIDPQERDLLFEKKKKIWDQMKRNMKVLENIGRREKHKLRELLKRKKKLRSLLEKYPNVQENETEALHRVRKMSCKIENLEKAKIIKLRKIKKELERIGNFCEEICENPFLLQEKKKHETTLLKGKSGDTYETLTNKKKYGMKPNSTFCKYTNRKFRKNRNNNLYEDPSYDENEWSTVDSSGMDSLLSNSSWNSFGALGKKGKKKNQFINPNRKSHTSHGTYRNRNSMNSDSDSSSNSISSRSCTSFLTNKNKKKKDDLCHPIMEESRKDRINNSEKPSVINTHSWHTDDDVFLENLEEDLKRNSEMKCPKEVSKEMIPRELKNASKENIKLMTKRDSNSNESNERMHEPIYRSNSGDIKKYSIYYENMSHLKSREDSNSSEGNVESVFKSDHMNSLVRMNPNENKITNVERKKKENNSESAISVTPDFKKEFHKMSSRNENPAYYVKEYPTKTNIGSTTSRSSVHSRYSTRDKDESSRNTPMYIEENPDLPSEPTYHNSVDTNSGSLEKHKVESSHGVGEYAIRIKKRKEKNNKNESSILSRRGDGSTVFSSVNDDRALTDFTPFQYFPPKYNKCSDTPTYIKKDSNGNINRIKIKNFRFPEKDLSRNRAYNNIINKKIVHLNVHK